MDKIRLEDTINLGRGKKIMVSELVKNKTELFNYIRNGYNFDDEVLSLAGIKRTIRNEKIITTCNENPIKEDKKLPKETESLKSILKSIHTIDNQSFEEDINEEECNYGIDEEYEK